MSTVDTVLIRTSTVDTVLIRTSTVDMYVTYGQLLDPFAVPPLHVQSDSLGQNDSL